MSQSDEVSAALNNLDAIKNGEDPRDEPDESAAVQQSNDAPQPSMDPLDADDPLTAARRECDRLWDEKDLDKHMDRTKLHVGITRWKSKNGQCRYGIRLTEHYFGRRVTSTGYEEADGNHVVLINEKIWEGGKYEEFIDTVRHEVAHAIAYAMHGTSQKHNHHWKALAAKLGADPKSCHNKHEKEGDYLYACPNGCWETIKTRRSKKIKRPWSRGRYCKTCDATPVACDRGGDPTELEPGEVQVEGIPWTNEDEYHAHPTQSIN